MTEHLRIALLTGSLAQGGAEKQLIYMAKALHERGVDVRVYSLTQNEYYQATLDRLGLHPIWVGKWGHPTLRMGYLPGVLSSFRPHILQSAQFFTNLYVSVAGRLLRAISIGCIRSDIREEFRLNKFWGNALLRMPSTILANSYMAQQNTINLGFNKEKIFVLPNVIDLDEFDRLQGLQSDHPIGKPGRFTVVAVARLTQVKRLERFIRAVALARQVEPSIRGVIIGDGPEMQSLKQVAARESQSPEDLHFAGARNDIPSLLSQAETMVLTSDFEGFPNVLLEGMAARLPVISTPAGDSGKIIRDGVSGYIIPFENIAELAEKMVRLYRSEELRHSMGQSGRYLVEQCYGYDTLADQMLGLYGEIAARQRNSVVLRLLAAQGIGTTN